MGKREEVILQKIARSCFGNIELVRIKGNSHILEKCYDCPLDTYLECLTESFSEKKEIEDGKGV